MKALLSLALLAIPGAVFSCPPVAYAPVQTILPITTYATFAVAQPVYLQQVQTIQQPVQIQQQVEQIQAPVQIQSQIQYAQPAFAIAPAYGFSRFTTFGFNNFGYGVGFNRFNTFGVGVNVGGFNRFGVGGFNRFGFRGVAPRRAVAINRTRAVSIRR